MLLFGLINYEDYIFKTIVTSNYARNALTILLMYLITGVIRFHLSVTLCWLFTMHNILDLTVPILINVILSLLSDALYQYVGTHKPSYEKFVDYLIANYSRDNMIKWKRYFLTGVFIYILIVLVLVNIDNTLLLVSTLQTAISFVICDILENREKAYVAIDYFFSRPKSRKLLKDFSIINDYQESLPGKELVSPRSISPPIPTKPPTPPRRLGTVTPLRPNKLTIEIKPPTSQPSGDSIVKIKPLTPPRSKDIKTSTRGD